MCGPNAECATCHKELFVRGDGTYPIASGNVFCAPQCQAEWVQKEAALNISGVVVGKSATPIPFKNLAELRQITER